MHPSSIKTALVAAILSGGIAALAQAAAEPTLTYSNSNLESNLPGVSPRTDADVLNPWGVANTDVASEAFFGNNFFVANNGSGTVTGYALNGAPVEASAGQQFVLTVPAAVGNKGTPTGIRLVDPAPARPPQLHALFDFLIPGPTQGSTTAAELLGVTQDGIIFGFSSKDLKSTNGQTAKVAKTVAGANYTGLAISVAKKANVTRAYLFAANTTTQTIDTFDNQFNQQTVANFPFLDPTPVAQKGSPVNMIRIEQLGKKKFYLIVAYAKLSASGAAAPLADTAGAGYVNLFKTDGTFVAQLVAPGSLAAPWGLAHNGVDLWVGDHGDGSIHRYQLKNLDTTPQALALEAPDNGFGQEVAITGLWGIHFAHKAATPAAAFAFGSGAYRNEGVVGYAAEPYTGAEPLGLFGLLLQRR